MARLRVVEFWPSTGLPGAAWSSDRGEDAFVKSARSVCELYSEALLSLQVQAPLSTLRFTCARDRHPTDGEVLVEIFVDRAQGFELARVSLPNGVEDLEPEARALLSLEVVHDAVVRLGAARGWETDVLEVARRHALDQGLRFVWAGPWNSSPDRQHRARAVYRLADDGYGRVIIEIQRSSDETAVAVSEEALAFSTSEGFKRSARTLRWDGRDTAQLVPYCGLGGEEQGLLRLDRTSQPGGTELEVGLATPSAGWLAPSEETEGFRVVVRARGANSSEVEPEIVVFAGGSRNQLARKYSTAFAALLGPAESPALLAWWSDAEAGVLEITCSEEAGEPKIRTRSGNNKLAAWIYRPITAIAGAGDPVLLARQDVMDLLAAVRRRTGLGPHPDLLSAEELGAHTSHVIQRQDASTQSLRALLTTLRDRLPAGLFRDLQALANEGAEGDVVDILRVQLPRLDIELTDDEAAELNAQQQPLLP